jgi:hypothetical protein
VRAQQAKINAQRDAEAAARAKALRNGQPSEQPKQIISRDSALGQASTAARGPGEAAKVFDGSR